MTLQQINGTLMEVSVDPPEGRSTRAGRDAGPADGADRLPPLVLLHGFPLDARVWADVARITSRHVETIRPNLRGFGRLLNAESFTIASLGEDVWALLKSMDRLPCVLAGLSMGGYVALAFARAHPESLAGLALVDSRAEGDTAEARRRRDEQAKLVRGSGPRAVVEQIFPKLLGPLARGGPVGEAAMRMMLDCPVVTIVHALEAMRDREDYRPLLGGLDVPAAVIVGEADELTPVELSREMADALPRGELSVISKAGHLAPLEQPQAVADALLELVRRSSAKRAARAHEPR